MKIVLFIDKYLEEMLCAALLGIMTIVIFLQIIFRVVDFPLSWTEEVGRYMFIWLIYIGAAGAVRKRKHISVDILDLVLKEKGQFILSIISNLIFLAFSVILFINSVPVVERVLTQLSPAIRMPMSIPYTSILVGSALLVLRLIQDTIARIREYKEDNQNGKAVTTDV